MAITDDQPVSVGNIKQLIGSGGGLIANSNDLAAVRAGKTFSPSLNMSGTCDSISGKTMMDKATITAQSVTLKVNKTNRDSSIISVDATMKPVGSGTAGSVSASTPTLNGTMSLTATILYKDGKFLIDDASWSKCNYGYIQILRSHLTLTYPIAASATEAEEKKIVTLGLLLEALGE